MLGTAKGDHVWKGFKLSYSMSWLCTGHSFVLAENITDKCIHTEKKEEEEMLVDIKTTILHAYTVQEIHVKCFNTFF
jgi:hypothetical protein